MNTIANEFCCQPSNLLHTTHTSIKDDSINCLPYNLTSHIMCGNHGTITFESPEYAVREDGNQIRLTLRRSGGGVGEVTVAYSIYPISAGYEDVTSTAYYTANQTVVFRPGQIRASFLLTINDDRLLVSSTLIPDTTGYIVVLTTDALSLSTLPFRKQTKPFQFTCQDLLGLRGWEPKAEPLLPFLTTTSRRHARSRPLWDTTTVI